MTAFPTQQPVVYAGNRARSREPPEPARRIDSLPELDAATGTLVQVISASAGKFHEPIGVSSDGTHVWVANFRGASVTELDAATGALVQMINASRYGFNQPAAVSSDGTDVWVTNPGDDSVTGFPASG